LKKDLGEGKSDFGQPVEQRVIMNGISPVSNDEKQCQGDRQEDRILNLNEFNFYLKCFYHLRLVNKMMLYLTGEMTKKV
jgi:hypothetical protein